MLRFLLTTALFVPAMAVVAQPADQPAAHSVPFGSQANTIELAVVNRSATETVSGTTIVLTTAPSWTTVSPGRLDVGTLGPEAEAAAAFTFDADRSAPVGEPAEVAFEVRDGGGRVLERVTFQIKVAAPAELALGTPFPNPSRDRATIPFEVPEAGPVRVTLFDMLGREVGVLYDGETQPGAHRAMVGGFASGTYVVRLVAGGKARVRQLTIVR